MLASAGVGELARDGEHLGLRLVVATAQPCSDRVRPAADRAGAVTKAGPGGEPHLLQGGNRAGELGDAFGQQAGVGRVADIGRHDRRVGPHLVELDEVGGVGFSEQGLVQLVDHLLAASRCDLHERRRVGHVVVRADPAKPPPASESVTSAHSVSKPSR